MCRVRIMQLQVSIISLYTRSLFGSDPLFLPVLGHFVPFRCHRHDGTLRLPLVASTADSRLALLEVRREHSLHGAPRQLPRQTQPPAANSMAGADKEGRINAADSRLCEDIASLPRRFSTWLRLGEVVWRGPVAQPQPGPSLWLDRP